MKRNKGFTLIELMIVVAIIAILAAIAVPNFLSFVSKSRRSEVKYNLEAIYKAEISWFGEYDVFDNNFVNIRWKPTGSNFYYTYSLGAAPEGKPIGANPMPAAAVPFAADNAFAAYGWGNVDSDNTIDLWHVDELKNMINDTDDLNS